MQPGTQLGHYEIVSALGKGGMGEVWRARDSKLGREVAIKTLPAEFAKDEERLARFEREAKLLASLNHPNIATIHGFEEENGTRFLVLELVEGDTLAERLKRGAIPVEESLTLALQIAEALEAAHEKGVIHRDLKPANIKVTPDGKIKVLDFGLAKAFAGDGPDVNLSQSPTLSMAATQKGVILGTAAYMSPEQASGDSTDKRADIWSFGVVLFEMVTGRQTFDGKTVAHVLADVLRAEPEWNSLPPNLHPRLRLLLERCLEKEAKDRCHDIADVRVDIQKVLADPDGVMVQLVAETTLAARRSQLPLVAAALVLGGLISGVAVWYLKPAHPPAISRWEHYLPEGGNFRNRGYSVVAISSDGNRFVYNGTGGLYLRAMDEREARVIPGTEESLSNPTFSPDGEWLAFVSGRQLTKIPVVGGAAVILDADIDHPSGISWEADDTILYGLVDGVMRVPAAGGEPELLVPRLDGERVGHPQLVLDARAVLFSTFGGQVGVHSVDSGESQLLFPGARPRYLPTGHILYAQGSVLFGVPFDIDQMEVTGDPVPLIEGVRSGPPQYAVSDSGSLVFVPGEAGGDTRMLVWVDREGREEVIDMPPRPYNYPRLSPTGDRVAVDIRDQERGIWVWDFERQNLQRLTIGDELNRSPVWTPDGARLAFSVREEDSENIYWQAADGSGIAEALTEESGLAFNPRSFSPDGKHLAFTAGAGGTGERDIHVVDLETGEIAPLIETPFNENNGMISPDGGWIAYDSDESGQREIWVRPFPNVVDARSQVSTGGGASPLWSHDGTELFYWREPGTLTVVPVELGESFASGTPEVLIQGDYLSPTLGTNYDVSSDGARFLMIKNKPDAETRPQVNVILNFFEELKERVPVP